MNTHEHNIRHSPRSLLMAIITKTPVQIEGGRSKQEADFRPTFEDVFKKTKTKTGRNEESGCVKLLKPLLPLEPPQGTQCTNNTHI